jgi:cytochrome P450 family 619
MVQIGKVLANTTTLLQPGTLPPVDLFPFLWYVPQRFFGNWRDKVDETRNIMNSLYGSYLELVVKRQKEEGPMGTFADRLLQKKDELNYTWHGLYFLAGLMMEAGSDTTSGAINNFMLLMTKFPGAYKTAQAEIDALVGEDRSPRWEDFDQLPAVNALVKETSRMRPIAPIAFPHALTEGNSATPVEMLENASALTRHVRY